MRITQAGKLNTYVGFALKHLKEHPDIPLQLHTAPPTTTTPSSSAPPTTTTKSLPQPTLTTPRLISVVEIIKREYTKLGGGGGIGLWQYNTSENGGVITRTRRRDKVKEDCELNVDVETGTTTYDRDGKQIIEEPSLGDDITLTSLLESKGSLHMSHSPYLIITLSARPLHHLSTERNTTYQPVLSLRRKKKPRSRRRDKDQPAVLVEGDDVGSAVAAATVITTTAVATTTAATTTAELPAVAATDRKSVV